MELILASSSPRRKEILSMLDMPFKTIPADIDESVRQNENPTDYVHRLSIEKAMKVGNGNSDSYVIGSDLTIDLDGKALGKAESKEEAADMIANLSGRKHETHCGYAIVRNSQILSSGVANTFIEFRKIPEKEIQKYIMSDKWQGFAGAYAVQGYGAKFVRSFIGSYFDILGMPLYEVTSALLKLGFQIDGNKLREIIQIDKQRLTDLKSN